MGRQHAHALCAAAAESRGGARSPSTIFGRWRTIRGLTEEFELIGQSTTQRLYAAEGSCHQFNEVLVVPMDVRHPMRCRQGGDGPRSEANSRRGTPAQQPQPSGLVWAQPQVLAALHQAPSGQLQGSGDLNKAATRSAAGTGAELGSLDLGPRWPISQVGVSASGKPAWCRARPRCTGHICCLLDRCLDAPNRLHCSSPLPGMWSIRLHLCPWGCASWKLQGIC